MTATLHLAWTVDDGPSKHTDKMMSVFKTAGAKPIPVTWFIQWDQLAKFSGALEKYKQLVMKSGHEVGLHGVSATANHIKWFPSADEKKPAYKSVKHAIEGIKKFQGYLAKQGIAVKFVRAPTGLVSELSSYLIKLGYTGVPEAQLEDTKKKLREVKKEIGAKKVALEKAKTPEKESRRAELKKAEAEQERLRKLLNDQVCRQPGAQARSMIKPDKCARADPTIEKVALDYQTLLKALERQNLKLWGGDATGKVSPQSWEAESSGVKARTDNVPDRINKMIIQWLGKGKRSSASFVILCHSTTEADVLEVKKDIAALETSASNHKVQIKYHTMTSLYKQVVGTAP